MFDAIKVKDEIVQYIRDWFEENGKDSKAIVAISGGADSSVVAALCVEALGKDRVFGVLMPDGYQEDLHDAVDLAKYLGIDYEIIEISAAVNVFRQLIQSRVPIRLQTEQSKTNLPPRIRMIIARMIAQNMNGRYINTCNYSEDYIGYFTIDGDGTGDCGPIRDLVKTEVKLVGRLLLPSRFPDKTPHAGLTNKTDEEDFGFSYLVLDRYIRTGEIDDLETKKKIDEMHQNNLFKLQPMAYYKLPEEYKW